jgi:hypothetical protein
MRIALECQLQNGTFHLEFGKADSFRILFANRKVGQRVLVLLGMASEESVGMLISSIQITGCEVSRPEREVD